MRVCDCGEMEDLRMCVYQSVCERESEYERMPTYVFLNSQKLLRSSSTSTRLCVGRSIDL